MKNINNPKWLLVANTLPFALLIFLYWSQFDIVNSLLDEETISLWKYLGGAGISLFIIHLVFTFFAIKNRIELHAWYAVTALMSYILFLYATYYHIDDLLPFDIPRWMSSDFLPFYPSSFLMPTLLHAMLILVTNRVNEEAEHQQVWKSLLGAGAVPIAIYIFTQVIAPSWRFADEFSEHVLIILAILALAAFLFLLIRLFYQLSLKRFEKWSKYDLLWKIPVAIIFPILGLAMNNGLIHDRLFLNSGEGVFGDFSHPWFYIIALVSGVLLCIRPVENPKLRLALFIGRSIGFSYTLYFFFVFMPFLPLSIVAILAMGLGFLMLTPLALAFIHVKTLYDDFIFLKKEYSSFIRYVILCGGMLTIPILISLKYQGVKNNMNKALAYMEAPSLSETYGHIDTSQLKMTLEVIEQNKERSNRGFFLDSKKTPFLSSYFNWLVMDNLILSNTKTNTLKALFFDDYFQRSSVVDFNASENVLLKEWSVESSYNEEEDYWTSILHLELENQLDRGLQEYESNFNLPEGTFINDYYLYVEDRKEHGILTEKKAAQWIYNQIRNTNRDPGLLVYTGENRINFKVFPFEAKQVRKTGIQFIHKKPVDLYYDNKIMRLGNDSVAMKAGGKPIFVAENYVYLDSISKSKLPLIERKPYYHFIIDISAGNADFVRGMEVEINRFLNKNFIPKTAYKVSYTNAYVRTFEQNGNFKTKEDIVFENGFYLGRALQKVFIESSLSTDKTYPIPVIITNNIYTSVVVDKQLKKLVNTIPEHSVYYELSSKGGLKAHHLNHLYAGVSIDRISAFNAVLAYPNAENPVAYAQNSRMGEGLRLIDKEPLNLKTLDNTWGKAVQQQAIWKEMTYHPNEFEDYWLPLLKSSFETKVMTPINAYMVVENEAQKKMLLKKQQQIIQGNKFLDLEEENPMSMTEPNLLWLILILLALVVLKNRQQPLKWI